MGSVGKMTMEILRDYIAHKQSQIDALIQTHGQGVRPGWVSEELSSLYFYMDDAIKELERMETEYVLAQED